MPLAILLSGSAARYLSSLDHKTRQRIKDKLAQIAVDPHDLRLSKPLQGTTQKSSRVGKYRILFEIDERTLFVVDIGPRGQIYKRIRK